MPEQPAARAPRQARRMTWSMLCVLPLCGIPAGAFAQTVPAALRACTAEADSARRLACYDREMARLSMPPPQPAAAPPPPQPALPPPSARAQSPPAVASTPPAAVPASREASAPHWSSPWKIFSGGDAARVTAHVARLDRSPNAMVLHLDNGQIWQQIGRASGDLTLREGDSVTIEEHLGSYWLSSRYVSDMKVRLAPAAR